MIGQWSSNKADHQLRDMLPLGIVLAGGVLAVTLAIVAMRLQSVLVAVGPLIVIGAAVAALRLPGVVLAAYFYIPFYKGALQPMLPIDITPVLAILCFVLALPYFLPTSSRGSHALPRVILGLWIGMATLVVLGTTYAIDYALAVGRSINFILLIFLPCLLALRVGRDPRLVVQFLAFSLVLSLGVSAVGVIRLGAVVASGPFVELGANTIGTSRAAMLLPLIGIASWRYLRTLLRWLVVLAIPVALVVAISTGSRGPLLMGVLSVAVVQLASWRDMGKKIVWAFVGLGLLTFLFRLPAVQALLPTAAVNRLESSLSFLLSPGSTNTLDKSSALRVELFVVASKMFQSRPILGYGTAGFEAFVRNIPDLRVFHYPHNTVLQVAAEYGFVGLIVFISFAGLALLAGFRRMAQPFVEPVLTLALFAFLNTLVSGGIVDDRWMWGMLLLIAARATAPAESTSRIDHSDEPPHGRSKNAPLKRLLIGARSPSRNVRDELGAEPRSRSTQEEAADAGRISLRVM